MIELDNPYAAPRTPTLRSLDEDRPWLDAVRVLRVERGFLYRRLVLEAPLELDLEYRGYNLFDTISIDGQIAVKKFSVWWFVPRFTLELRSDRRGVPIVVDVRVGKLLQIRAFSVEVAGKVVYSEGLWACL